MSILIDLLDNYIFSGVPSNAAWDLMKAAWSKAHKKSWEALYVESFKQATEEEKPLLAKYGDFIALDERALSEALRRDLAVDLASLSVSEMNDKRFAKQLGEAMADRSVLIIGGHNLSPADYTQLVCNLVRHARAHFKAAVLESEDAFRKALLEESLAIQARLHDTQDTIVDSNLLVRDVQNYLENRFDLLIGKLDAIAGRVKNIEEALLKGEQPASPLTLGEQQTYEQQYLEQVRRECNQLYKEGVYGESAKLADVFIMLETQKMTRQDMHTDIPPGPPRPTKTATGTSAEQRTEDDPRPPAIPLSLALHQHQYIVLLGDSGSGKTTMLQFIALYYAPDPWAREQLELNESRIPIRVRLGKYNRTEAFLEELLSEEVAYLGKFDPTSMDVSLRIAKGLVKNWLDSQPLVLLLDGLDEVQEAERTRLVEEITRFAQSDEGQRHRILVTSRIANYRTQQRPGDPFSTYVLRPFSRQEDSLQYTIRWMGAIVKSGASAEFLKGEKIELGALRLVEEMEQRGGLRHILGNPLLLRMAISYYIDQREIVQNRADLFRQYVDKVLVALERTNGMEKARWDNPQLKEALEISAWELHTAEEPLTKADLATLLEAKVKGIDNGIELIDYMRERLGLLASHGYQRGELIEFWHIAFREFYVARRLAIYWQTDKESTWRFLRPRLHLPKWQEPIRLMGTMLRSKIATELVRHVLEVNSPYEQELHRDLVFAGQYLASAPQIDSKLSNAIIDRLVQIYLREAERDTAYTPSIQQLLIQPIEEVMQSLSDRDPRVVLSLIKYAEQDEDAETRVAAIVALGNLPRSTPNQTQVLLRALQNDDTRVVAAEALAKSASGDNEIVQALLASQRQYLEKYQVWDQTVDAISGAIGVLGQRHASVVDLLRDVAEDAAKDEYRSHYVAAYALCKSAETSLDALKLVLRGLHQVANSNWYQVASLQLLDKDVREGLKDGRHLFRTVSPSVIQYLLDMVQNKSEPITYAEYFLDQVMGETPHVRCKVVAKDGRFHYLIADYSDKLFDAFLTRPYVEDPFGPAFSVFYKLTSWGLNNPENIARIVRIIQEDSWLLAQLLEEPLIWQPEDIADLGITDFKESIARLRSRDDVVRSAEANRWHAIMQTPRTEKSSLRYLSLTLIKRKMKMIYGAYAISYGRLWWVHENEWDKPPRKQASPYVLAALSCIRGWKDIILSESFLTERDLQREFDTGVDQVLNILENPGRHAAGALSTIVAGEEARFTNDKVEQRIREDFSQDSETENSETLRQRRLPDFRERIASAYTLAQLAGEYPDVQSILVQNLKIRFLGKGEFQEHLVRAFGLVENAGRDLVAALLEIAAEHDKAVYMAGSRSLGQLRNPSSEVVSLMSQRYKELGMHGQVGIIKYLGTLESQAPDEIVREVVRLLLNALNDSRGYEGKYIREASAEALGNLEEPDSLVIDALVNSIENTPSAASALAKLSRRSIAIGLSAARDQLSRIADAVRDSLAGLNQATVAGRSGYDVAYEALSRIATRLSEIDTDNSQTEIAIK